MSHRILYVAPTVDPGGSDGGAEHVRGVARALAARGHRLTVASRGVPRGRGLAAVSWTTLQMPRFLAWSERPAIGEIAAAARPDRVIERYYNFGGAGLAWARRHGVPGLLEVNAPVVDPPGSLKETVDGALGRPLRRWAGRQVDAADAIVTPLAATVTRAFPAAAVRVHEVPWGADVEAFAPAAIDEGERAALARALGVAGREVLAFVGSFRTWHGVEGLVRAAAPLLRDRPDRALLLVGGGPRVAAVETLARTLGVADGVVLAGRVPHDRVPLHYALARAAVAPFEPAAHPPLAHFGFYWSPLKVFEAMAMGLGVVVPDLPALVAIVGGEEAGEGEGPGPAGWFYREGDRDSLTGALAAAWRDRAECRRRGALARARVVERYAWDVHAARLEAILDALGGPAGRGGGAGR